VAQGLFRGAGVMTAVKIPAYFRQQERERQTGYDTANYNGKVFKAYEAVVRAPRALPATKFIVKRGLIRVFFCPTLFSFSP
jgi:hypothetical protein